MPTATIKLPTGAVITIEGSPAEIKELLEIYGRPSEGKSKDKVPKDVREPAQEAKSEQCDGTTSISEIVRLVKDCDEAEQIETRILDTTSQVNRILLPLFIVHKYLHDTDGLTTGEISTITKQLGIPIHVANVSNAIKGSAARYVIGDAIRGRGQTVRYKLSRRGAKYIQNVVDGTSDGD